MAYFASFLLLGSLVLFILGCIGLFNFQALGMKSRGQSSAIFFGATIACLIVGFIAFPTTPTDQTEPVAAQSKNPEATGETTGSVSESKTEPTSEPEIEYFDAVTVGQHFHSLTDLQRDAWNQENRLVIPTQGSCIVAQVQKTNWASQIQNTDYEVECEIIDDVKPVVYFTKEHTDLVTGLNIGDTLNYVGMVHSANHSGLWTSVYIMGN